MKTYIVTVETSGFSADYLTDFLVVAQNAAEANVLARQEAEETWPTRSVGLIEAYELGLSGPARVIRRLVDPDE